LIAIYQAATEWKKKKQKTLESSGLLKLHTGSLRQNEIINAAAIAVKKLPGMLR
jgi:hypothetical protein